MSENPKDRFCQLDNNADGPNDLIANPIAIPANNSVRSRSLLRCRVRYLLLPIPIISDLKCNRTSQNFAHRGLRKVCFFCQNAIVIVARIVGLSVSENNETDPSQTSARSPPSNLFAHAHQCLPIRSPSEISPAADSLLISA